MIAIETLAAPEGAVWHVEYAEDQRLTHIGGFLMTCGAEVSLTLSAQLSSDAKARGRAALLRRLATTPVGTASLYLWHPHDEPSDTA